MTAIRNFVLVAGAIAASWLLWRLNQAVGSEGVLLIAGIVVGLFVAGVAVVIVWVVLDVRRQPQQDAPQAQQAQPPVLIMLGDGSAANRSPYQAPAGLFTAPANRQVAEREEWIS